MISNKDINFNDELQILTINGEKHAVLGDPVIPGEIDSINDRVTALEEVSGVITLNTDGGWLFAPNTESEIKKQGSIAWLSAYIYNSNNLTPNTMYEIGTIPTDFIPSKAHKFPIYGGAATSDVRGIVEIGDDGKLLYRSLDGGRYAIYTTIIYPLT